MEGRIEKHEEESTDEFASKSTHPEEESAKLCRELVEYENVSRFPTKLLTKDDRVNSHMPSEVHAILATRKSVSTSESFFKALELEHETPSLYSFMGDGGLKLLSSDEKPKKTHLTESSKIFKPRVSDLTFKSVLQVDQQTCKTQPAAVPHCDLERPSSSYAQTSTSGTPPIKLSAKHLISRRELREKYLVDIIKKSTKNSSSKPLFLVVDLSEIELEFGKHGTRQEPSSSEDCHISRISTLRDYHYSLVVRQTEGDSLVSNWAIKTLSEIFHHLKEVFHLESVDASDCILPTQVSLLPRLLSTRGMKLSSMKVICSFSKDFLHLKEDEFMFFLGQAKSLVEKGDVSKEEFQELMNQCCSFFCAVDNEKVTHALIEAGADVNITDEEGKTPLFYAVDNEKLTNALTKAGAAVNTTDKDGKTALFYANWNEKVTHALIEAGADVNITDKDGKTALFYGVQDNKVTHALINTGADVNITDKNDKTALFYAVYDEKITHALIEAGVDVNITDKDGKTALFYAVDNENVTHKLIKAGTDVKVADKDGKTIFLYIFDAEDFLTVPPLTKILLESGSSLCETTEEQESVFHLALNLCQQKIFSSFSSKRQKLWNTIMDAFELFPQSSKSKVAVNKRDMHLNSPLHLWASLALASPSEYSVNLFGDYSFEQCLRHILKLLLKCGIRLNYPNEQEQTPLHVCRTWTAVKLLLDDGAKSGFTDSSGCKPLLAAAMKNNCLKSGHLYPDATQNPLEFWREVLKKKLDPWTADEEGNSVLSILVKEGAQHLAKGLIEVACELKLVQKDEIGVRLLITICRDKSTDKEWKVDLVKTLLKYRKSLAQESLSDKDTALHFCCRNMLELPEESVKTSVHWEIAQHLISCGAIVETPGKEGKSCLDIAESCPVLKDLLSMSVNIEEVPPLIDSWKPVSLRHRDQLEKVSRGFNCQQIETVYYFSQALDNGTFGLVFVGINTQDGKEVAIKQIETMRVDKENIKKEIEDLKMVISCDKIIQCLLCTNDKEFIYVILELMEGNLDDLLSDDLLSNDLNQETKLCRDICMGLDYLHNHDRNIIHRGIKPSNILYQVLNSGINLKLAFFGLRSQMCQEQCTSDFTDTYESQTKERCWMAPEVLQSQSHSKSSDVFSCGLVIHYLLTNKKHPFAPGGSSKDRSLTVGIETVDNIAHNKVELDETISSDAKDLVRRMLHQDKMSRPNTFEILHHGFFQKGIPQP